MMLINSESSLIFGRLNSMLDLYFFRLRFTFRPSLAFSILFHTVLRSRRTLTLLLVLYLDISIFQFLSLLIFSYDMCENNGFSIISVFI